jgi:alkylresorcinol/alkylpyrone synthase
MTTIAAVSAVLPEHCHEQLEITEALAGWAYPEERDQALLRRFHANAMVKTRHTVLELDAYRELADFGASNDVFIAEGTRLGARAISEALQSVGLTGSDVDLVLSTTVTGVAAPSLEARIAPLVGLRPDVRRLPLFGLGCVAGAAGIARTHDYLLSHPADVAVLLSVELCSLTVQANDRSAANMVASGLFGDGASAVVMLGEQRAAQLGLGTAGPRVLDSRSHLYPDTSRTMGWDVRSSGLQIVLGADVPELVEKYLAEDVKGLLSAHDLDIADVGGWVSHPGGPKVIEAVQRSLGLVCGELDLTWRSLATVGNLSSSSVLHVLADTIAKGACEPGSPGVLLAMGPGFCSELVLLEW